MRNRNSQVRTTKRKLSKCNGVCRTYNAIQYAYADILVSPERFGYIIRHNEKGYNPIITHPAPFSGAGCSKGPYFKSFSVYTWISKGQA